MADGETGDLLGWTCRESHRPPTLELGPGAGLRTEYSSCLPVALAGRRTPPASRRPWLDSQPRRWVAWSLKWGILRERAGPPGDSERGSTLAVLEREVGSFAGILVEAVYKACSERI
jgi:hypothetical protein